MRLILLFTLLSFTATAQEFGLSLGTNYTFVQDFEKKAKPGIDFNLVYSTPSGDGLDYQLEIGYSQTRPLEDLKYQYLRVAFIPKVYLTHGLNFQIGPRMGYLAKGTSSELDIKSPTNFAHLAILAGIGYRFEKIDISLRYNHGLTNIAEDTKDKGLQATVGIFL